VQCAGRQPKSVSGLLGGEKGGCRGVLIVEHHGAMLASKCEIYQVNSGKLGVWTSLFRDDELTDLWG
jgi:hypothetical protein